MDHIWELAELLQERDMIYVKSVLAGVAALVVASVLYIYIYYAFFIRPELPKVPPGTAVGLDVRVFNLPFFSLIALLAFAIGFYWEFRRASG
ncbi:MAG: hypothetical protein DMG57_36345 [Acidobacteria bacterium]|nr:MAG: hypothetical protein DMG57_36345 [Acidobacteriota bacterium]